MTNQVSRIPSITEDELRVIYEMLLGKTPSISPEYFKRIAEKIAKNPIVSALEKYNEPNKEVEKYKKGYDLWMTLVVGQGIWSNDLKKIPKLLKRLDKKIQYYYDTIECIEKRGVTVVEGQAYMKMQEKLIELKQIRGDKVSK